MVDPGGENGELLSIGEISAKSGITPDTIRVWERRYGRPVPVRLPSGHRRYHMAHVRWLRRVAEALARGHRASQVIPLREEEIDSLLVPAGSEAEDRASAEATLDLVRRFDGPGIRRIFRREFEGLGARAFLTRRLEPLLTLVGREWADGELQIRHEHFLSGIVMDFLRGRRMAEPEANGPLLLFATLPDETHGLGLQIAALLAAAAGARPRVLGTDTPVAEIAAAAREMAVRAVGVSVTLATGGPATDRELAALRAALPAGVTLIVGGAGARGPRRGPKGVAYAEHLACLERLLFDIVRADAESKAASARRATATPG